MVLKKKESVRERIRVSIHSFYFLSVMYCSYGPVLSDDQFKDHSCSAWQ